ncbi:conserved Plasmodium protein, unknown function [Plasmodium relictum]|uniref:Uncharacterized protein n=1 Tax=Plasmodium relictum TaxID=85471 RepID=A0A1J1H1L5_PLARL|nr:conserved Plasmodium protein, unknown function [Plasmodium relictum]CRG98747.1 conserved Plasmodium protein, unknown function [Plasmodium relictum]
MNSQFFMKHDNLKKEKNKNKDIYSEKVINLNNEKFLKNYQNYLKNINNNFIYTHHNIFKACNQNNLEGILSHYKSSIITEKFKQKIVCALNFKLELLENYKMYKEDKYLRSLLKIENHIKNHKLRQNYNIKMEKKLYERNIRAYKNYQKHKLEKEHSEKRKKMNIIIKYFINAAFRLRKIEVNFDNYFFYDNMFFLEKFFFVKQIKNINEVLQNNELMNEANHVMANHDKFEKKLKHYNEYKRYSNNFYTNFNFLKSLKIDRFFLLNLRNTYVEEKNDSIEKFGYLYMLEYLHNQEIWSFVNNTKLSKKPIVKFNKYSMDYKRKILENIQYIDFNYAKEKMGDKYFYFSQDEDIEKKIKELSILKFLILKTFRQYSNKKKFNRKYKYPLRIIITGKIKKEIKHLAICLKKTFSLKIYDFNNIKKEVHYICSMKNTQNEKKRKILIKLKDIIRKLDEEKIDKRICDNLYVDLLYYRIKYDYDMFYTKEHDDDVKRDYLEEKEIKNIKNSKMKKSKKYRGYIIINFFFSLKQYILFELKLKKLFLFNNYIHEHVNFLQHRNISIKKKKENFLKKFAMLSNSKCKNTVIPKKIETKNYGKSNIKLKIKNEENRNKNLSDKKENIISKKKLHFNTNFDIEDIDSFTEKNILFFSNFLCKIEDFFYEKNNILGGIDLHFHIDKNIKQITNFLFRFINKNFSYNLEEKDNNNKKCDNVESKNDEKNIIKLRKIRRKVMRAAENIQIFHSQTYKGNYKVICKIKKSYKTLKDKIKKDTNYECFSKGIFDESKKIFFLNSYFIKKVFHFDKNYIEIEKFLKSYKSLNYSRYHILKNNIYKSSSNLISKIISLIEKDKMKRNDKKRKKNSDIEKNSCEISHKEETDINNSFVLINHIKLDSNFSYYFRLRYCNIIKVYITHLFNFFVWKRVLEKNINKVVKYIHKNIYIFIDYINIEDINKFIQLYNGLEEFEIENEKVKFLLLEKLNIIQKRMWLEILKQKNNNNKKEKIYLNKWINMQIFLLIFQNFYLINIEHQLYLNLDYFVNEYLYALIHNEIIFKNDKNMLIFNYFPKNKKELYIYDKNNYYFPFLNYIKENINNFLIESCDYKKNFHKNKNSESHSSDSFCSKREKKLYYLAKEFRFINNCRFFYKFHELVNYSIINLRKYFYIFQDLNSYINNFITLHYLCVYKQINFTFDTLRNFIQNSAHIPFYYLSMFNKRKFQFEDKINKLNEIKYEKSNLKNRNNENKYICNEERREINISSINKINKKEKSSEEKYRCLYSENGFFNNLISYNNNNENDLFLKKNYIYIFLNSILKYIFILQHFPVISKVDLGNLIMASLFFIKEKSEKIYANILFKKILNEYVKKYSITINSFILPNSMINNISLSYTYPWNKKEENQNSKMGRIKKDVKKEIFKKCCLLFDDISTETKNTTNNNEIKKNDLYNKDIYENNNYYMNQFNNDDEIKKTNNTWIQEENNIDNSETHLCLQSLEYFTFKEFLHLGLFNFIKNKKKFTREEKKVLNYEIILLNKFIFNYFFYFSKFPYFHENIQIYIKNYLLKKNSSFFSSFEEALREKIQNIDNVNSQLFKSNKKEKKKNIEINKKINNLTSKRMNSLTSYNAKKKVMVKEILIFFHNKYDYNF